MSHGRAKIRLRRRLAAFNVFGAPTLKRSSRVESSRRVAWPACARLLRNHLTSACSAARARLCARSSSISARRICIALDWPARRLASVVGAENQVELKTKLVELARGSKRCDRLSARALTCALGSARAPTLALQQSRAQLKPNERRPTTGLAEPQALLSRRPDNALRHRESRRAVNLRSSLASKSRDRSLIGARRESLVPLTRLQALQVPRAASFCRDRN